MEQIDHDDANAVDRPWHICICVVFASLWRNSQERRVGPDVFEQIHDGMREADVIALLGTPWPATYDADGNPIPVALVAGVSWDIVRVVPSQAAGAHDSGVAKRLEFVGDEWGISVSFNVAGQLAWRALLQRARPVDPISKMDAKGRTKNRAQYHMTIGVTS